MEVMLAEEKRLPRMTLELLMHHRSLLLQRHQSQRLRMTLELLMRPLRKQTTLGL